jgi:polyphosphate kinase
MEELELTDEDVALLNFKIGLRKLFVSQKLNVPKALRYTIYENELRGYQAELVKLQTWVIENNKKVVILFEGRDAAGKGGAIRRITAHINPRHFKIVALNKPTDDERGQWYFQRYVNHLPKPGEIVFFDRSWYNRAVVEPVNEFCTKEEYKIFMSEVNQFEKMMVQSDIYFIKFYFSISKTEQAKRFDDLRNSNLKKWKMSPLDEKAQDLWEDYTRYKKVMYKRTDTKHAPWTIIKADKKTLARLAAIKHILDVIPYN